MTLNIMPNTLKFAEDLYPIQYLVGNKCERTKFQLIAGSIGADFESFMLYFSL
jgi:hypothetical protein